MTRERRVDHAQVAALYESGWTTTALADRFGLNAGYVSRLLRQAGVAMRPPGVRATAISPADLAQARVQCPSAAAMAERFGVSVATVHRRMDAAGLPPFPVGKPAGTRKIVMPSKELVRARAECTCAREVAERLGVSVTTVYRRFAEAGIPAFPRYHRGRP